MKQIFRNFPFLPALIGLKIATNSTIFIVCLLVCYYYCFKVLLYAENLVDSSEKVNRYQVLLILIMQIIAIGGVYIFTYVATIDKAEILVKMLSQSH